MASRRDFFKCMSILLLPAVIPCLPTPEDWSLSSPWGKRLVMGTRPPDGTTGYAPGCMFVDTRKGLPWLNMGTASRAQWQPIDA